MHVVALLISLAVGLLQIAATIAGVEDWLGAPGYIAVILALSFAWMPVLGTVVGLLGAVIVWGWPWPMALGLFFGPLIILAGYSALTDAYTNMMARYRAT